MQRSLIALAALLLGLSACSPTQTTAPTPTNEPVQPSASPTATVPPSAVVPGPVQRAGLRASSYGPADPFPAPAYWVAASGDFASRFNGAQPAVLWIVGEIEFTESGGDVRLGFPDPQAAPEAEHILYSPDDTTEAYLDAFDESGVQVWLQVEPGDADVSTLIKLVLGRYGGHSSVVGFGVDLEWLRWSEENDEGSAVSDAEAQAWSEQLRAINPDYELLLKHWEIEMMPPSYREGLLFLDDSQEFESLDAMLDEFADWGAAFAPAPVGFQFGYAADQGWWGDLADPPRHIGESIGERISNARELYWVDFTMDQIWPRSE